MRVREASLLDIKSFVGASFVEPIRYEDIASLSLSSRCSLIREILLAREAVRGRVNSSDSFDASRLSLLNLSKAFEVSSAYYEWEDRRLSSFKKALKEKRNSPILTAYKRWANISVEMQKTALRKSVRLQRNVFAEGFVERLPYRHLFKEGARRQQGYSRVLIFGGFRGNIKTGSSELVQYTENGRVLLDPKGAFDTAHHEGAHLMQHHLSYAFHKKQISPCHPLFSDAAYFNALDVRGAYLSTEFGECYDAQPVEVLANWQGRAMADIIEELSL